ncbi:MAG: hypothetical protein B6242_11230 [Anaerolineaceae bacterium 4572_78]|nr:MAG: hypothetical protein B6242_11230 [Anaerolineaceae bacterium 4572_78]
MQLTLCFKEVCHFDIQKIILLFSIIILFTVTACTQTTSEPESEKPAEVTKIKLGVGFIPNVQFSPLYVAQKKGFYAEEGLEVELEYGYENDFVALVAQGERQFAIASGDQVILGRSQGLPITYIMKWFERFPVAVMALKEKGIDSPEKLQDVSVGVPGLFGASYIGWKALVYAENIDESKITLESIGFTQAESISKGTIDAAVVYIANEPIQLAQAGYRIDVIEVSDYIDLISNGLITNEKTIKENPELVRKMVKATLKGIAYAIENPDETFQIAREVVPEITDETAPIQKSVLNASITLWQSSSMGMTDREAWQESMDFMVAMKLIDEAIDIDSLHTNEFVNK